VEDVIVRGVVVERFCAALTGFLWNEKNGNVSADHRSALAKARAEAKKLPDNLYRAAVERAFKEAGCDR
jgi:hypothetical protein